MPVSMPVRQVYASGDSVVCGAANSRFDPILARCCLRIESYINTVTLASPPHSTGSWMLTSRNSFDTQCNELTPARKLPTSTSQLATEPRGNSRCLTLLVRTKQRVRQWSFSAHRQTH